MGLHLMDRPASIRQLALGLATVGARLVVFDAGVRLPIQSHQEHNHGRSPPATELLALATRGIEMRWHTSM